MPSAAASETLAHLHLMAVLPALEDLVRLSPPAAHAARKLTFPVRMSLRGGPSMTIAPLTASGLRVSPEPASGALNLTFLTAHQLNRTFTGNSAWPPVPGGHFWHLVRVKALNNLTKLLDSALQPSAEALADPAFFDVHLRLLFRVLIGALPIIAARDRTASHTLETTPAGVAQICMDGLSLRGWVRWDGKRLMAGVGDSSTAPDAIIRFRDADSAAAALRSQLDATAAVGLGLITVQGLVPLADGLSVAMDRVETYLQPAS